MKAQSYDGKALPYVLITPDGYDPAAAYPLVLILHGFGANMYDLAGVAQTLDPQGYIYALPNGPFRIPFGGGEYGYSWTAGRPGVEPRPELPPLDELLATFLDELTAQTQAVARNIIVGGFSMGGGQALHFGLPRPETFAGVFCLSGRFGNHDALLSRLPSQRTTSVFLAHGRQDPMVPLEHGQETKAFLEAAGYPVEYHEYDMAHQIIPAELDDLRSWLHRVLPPKA